MNLYEKKRDITYFIPLLRVSISLVARSKMQISYSIERDANEIKQVSL